MIHLLGDQEIEGLVPLAAVVDLVESAFLMDARGESRSFPVVRTLLEDHDGIFGIKSGRLLRPDTLGLKAGGYWRGNPAARQLSAHQSTIVLFRSDTGQPEAVLRANYITEARTGAAGAVAATALARPDARTVGVLGAGRQARAQIRALATRFPLTRVRIAARRADAAQALADEFRGAAFEVEVAADAEHACLGADIVVTTTPSFEPILDGAWIAPGTHVNAMGSDTRGKGELDARLLERARLIVDDVQQALDLGEAQRVAGAASIAGTLGAVLNRTCPGRTGPEEVTVFDSTGVTFQDLVVARHALDRARATGVGREVEL